jgi:cytochrome c oxidase subunit 2
MSDGTNGMNGTDGTTGTTGTTGTAPPERRDGRNILVAWLVLCAITEPLLILLLGPHLPPGAMSENARSQQIDNIVLSALALPVVMGVLLYFAYALVFWRAKEGDDTDGPPIHGNTRVQVGWIAVTAAIVLSLAVYGTVELVAPAGAGAGEGPSPVWKPGSNNVLQVQVIGQQWRWTYRYPTFGGMETTELVLPVGVPIEFHVTSLDVIHSFWAYQLGVKADANPQVDNVSFSTISHTGQFTVRCAELCGIWHGAMDDFGKVMTQAGFEQWATSTETQLTSVTKLLPPYATSYNPDLVPQLGKALTSAGLSGAGGNFYGPQYSVQP